MIQSKTFIKITTTTTTAHTTYLDKKVEKDHGFHFDSGVDLIVKEVVGNLFNITKCAVTNSVHQRDHVGVADFKNEVGEEIKDGKTAHVKREPLVMEKVSSVRRK